MKIEIYRVYDELPAGTYRILVDRLWPRGIKKTDPNVDEWVKDVAPSTQLRKWYNHEEVKAQEFEKRYLEELKNNAEAIAKLKKVIVDHKNPILVFAAKSPESNATVLQEFLAKS